jgi:hypothetical protein
MSAVPVELGGRANSISLSAPGAERVGVRWGIPECLPVPTSPSRFAGPSLSPLKGGEGFSSAAKAGVQGLPLA